jgi:hypothetical protein
MEIHRLWPESGSSPKVFSRTLEGVVAEGEGVGVDLGLALGGDLGGAALERSIRTLASAACLLSGISR